MAQKLPVLAGVVLVFLPWFFLLFVFLRFIQSLPMIFADIMGMFLGLDSSDQRSLFSSGALL
jgi:hypothetical protein